MMPNASNTTDVVAAIGGQRRGPGTRVIAVQGPEARARLARVSAAAATVHRFAVSGSNGPARRAWWRAPATPGKKESNAPFLPTSRAPSGRRCSAKAWRRPGSGRVTRSVWRLGSLFTVTSWARASPHCRQGWGGSSDGTRATSPGGLHWKRSGRTVPPGGSGIRRRGAPTARDGALLCEGPEQVGIVTSGNFSPMRERGIGLGFVDADARLLDGDPVTVLQRGRELPAASGAAPPVAGPRRPANSAVRRTCGLEAPCRIVGRTTEYAV